MHKIYTHETLTIEAFENVHVRDRFSILSESLELAPAVGHIMEFGVFQGKIINFLAGMAPGRQVHGFDSFEGLPEAWTRTTAGGSYPKGHFDLKGQLPIVKNNVDLFKGYFEDTLPEWLVNHPGNVAFIHNDSDLYSSTIYVLKQLNRRITPGTVIVFDELCDWDNVFGATRPQFNAKPTYDNWRLHEWKALLEWMKECNRKISIIGRGQLFQAAVIVA